MYKPPSIDWKPPSPHIKVTTEGSEVLLNDLHAEETINDDESLQQLYLINKRNSLQRWRTLPKSIYFVDEACMAYQSDLETLLFARDEQRNPYRYSSLLA